MLREIDNGLLLPQAELGILETLFVEGADLAASDIAAELDCSYQLVGKRGKIMADRGLVQRKTEKNRRMFALTPRAREDYFRDNPDRKLNVREDW